MANPLLFNCPPNWPAPPDGWQPSEGWQPDPSWGPAPDGWDLWVPQVTDEASSLGKGRSKLKSWAEAKEEVEAKRAAKRGEAVAPPPVAHGVESGWWIGIPKVTVAVNVRYLNVKTLTKSMGLGTLKVNPDEGLTWRANLGPKLVLPWSVIESIEIDGEKTSRMTLTRVATIGVFALGARKKRTDTTMIVATPTKEYMFEFEKTEPTVVRNKLRPVLSALAAATGTAVAAPDPHDVAPLTPAPDLYEQLSKLGALRDQGILNAEEFAAQKTKLLG